MSDFKYKVEYSHDGQNWHVFGFRFTTLNEACEQAVKSLLSGTGNKADSHVRIREVDTGKIVWSHNRADWPEGGSGA